MEKETEKEAEKQLETREVGQMNRSTDQKGKGFLLLFYSVLLFVFIFISLQTLSLHYSSVGAFDCFLALLAFLALVSVTTAERSYQIRSECH